ncbi:MAG: response regulator [Bacteroidales bacterium]|nr:response regulator [Bacteroidales bacterium]
MSANSKNNNLIIIAEDSLTQAESLKYVLEGFGYRVLVGNNGETALSLIKKEKPLLVITDVIMPVLDGYELCRYMKTDKNLYDVPVILLTSLADATDVIRGLESGADSYIMKPFTEKYLLSRIKNVLANRHLLRNEKSGKALNMVFAGESYSIDSNPSQILNMLLSTYESAVQRNLELITKESELVALNSSLHKKVKERKKELTSQLAEKKESESVLKKSEEKYRDLVDNALTGVYIANSEGELLFANEAMLSILEYESIEELLSVNTQNLYKHSEDRDKLLNILELSDEVASFETELVTRIGNTKHVILSVNLVNGILSGTILDITEWKQLEERNKKYEMELIAAKGKAIESEKLKTAFLANMSNDILTPMNTIMGFSELLGDPDLPNDKLLYFSEQINTSSNNLVNLIDNIIDIAKVESGGVSIKLSECKINDLLLDLYAYFDNEIKEKGKDKVYLKLRRASKNKDFAILSEPYRLRRILSNILKNAVNYTDSGEIEFGYSIQNGKSDEKTTSQGQMLQFFVRDKGKGISKEKLDLIFDRFRQSEDSYTKQFEGAGLSLPISRAYVELLGGEMWCESVEGEGSEFYFTVPCKIVKGKPGTPDTVTITKANLENINILVAEDVESNYRFIESVLKRSKARLIWSKNGKEALEKFKEDKSIDLILMDMRMPLMSGFEATKEIRKINKEIPIIAQTAFTGTEDKELFLDTGCNDYISKPIDKDLLIKVVGKYV